MWFICLFTKIYWVFIICRPYTKCPTLIVLIEYVKNLIQKNTHWVWQGPLATCQISSFFFLGSHVPVTSSPAVTVGQEVESRAEGCGLLWIWPITSFLVQPHSDFSLWPSERWQLQGNRRGQRLLQIWTQNDHLEKSCLAKLCPS